MGFEKRIWRVQNLLNTPAQSTVTTTPSPINAGPINPNVVPAVLSRKINKIPPRTSIAGVDFATNEKLTRISPQNFGSPAGVSESAARWLRYAAAIDIKNVFCSQFRFGLSHAFLLQ